MHVLFTVHSRDHALTAHSPRKRDLKPVKNLDVNELAGTFLDMMTVSSGVALPRRTSSNFNVQVMVMTL